MHHSQQHDPSQKPSMMQDMRAKMSWIRLLADSWAMVFIVIFRRNFGSRFLDHRGLIGMVMLIFFPVFWSRYNVIPLLWLLGFYIIMIVRARIEIARRQDRPIRGPEDVVHSRYNGECRIARFYPNCDEQTLKEKKEPLVVLVCGLILLPFNPPLASFTIIGAFCMIFSMSVIVMYDKARAQDAIDAMIEAHQHANRVRNMWGERW